MQNENELQVSLLESFQKRYKSARVKADLWADLLEACYHYAVPFRNRFYQPKQQQGEQKNARLYDTTAVEATKTFVSKLHDAMTPPQVQWGFLEADMEFEAEPGNDEEKAAAEGERMELQGMLDVYTRRLFKYIHASNFDVVINECYFDLSIGTSCLVINSHTDKQPLLFTSIPADKLAIEEGLNGKIESWFRTWDDIKIRELTTRWRKAVPTADMLMEMSEDIDAKVSRLYEGVLYNPENKKPYTYAVWSDEGFVFAEELESNPAIVWRFQKTNNEIWGRGPVMEALPSIMSLQEMAKIELASANLNTFKPYMGFSDGVFNPHTFRLKPFTVIPIAPIGSGGQFPLVPLPDSSNPQFAQLTINDLRSQIKTLMFSENITQTDSVQPQTATEVMQKQQSLAQKIGPLFSRLQHEFLEPVIERCAYVLDKMGILPRPTIDGKLITFKYRSPLALSKGQQDVQMLMQFTQVMQQISGPEVTQLLINPQEAPWLVAENLQIDPRYLLTQEQFASMAQQMAANKEQMPGAEPQEQQGEPQQNEQAQ